MYTKGTYRLYKGTGMSTNIIKFFQNIPDGKQIITVIFFERKVPLTVLFSDVGKEEQFGFKNIKKVRKSSPFHRSLAVLLTCMTAPTNKLNLL